MHKALEQSEPQPYQLSQAKDAPVLGAYKEQIEAMLVENERLLRKQRYTSRKIYRALRETGYQGAESTERVPKRIISHLACVNPYPVQQ